MFSLIIHLQFISVRVDYNDNTFSFRKQYNGGNEAVGKVARFTRIFVPSRSCDISLTFSFSIVVSEVSTAIYRRPSSDNDTTRESNPETNKGINKFHSAQAYKMLL